jgi:hypothetical protein
MLKLFLISLIVTSTNLLTSEPASTPKPDEPKAISALEKCIKRELAVYAGHEKPNLSEFLFGSGCYKLVPADRTKNTALIKKCHEDQDFRALIIKQYCEKKTKV